MDSFCSIALLTLERKEHLESFGQYQTTVKAIQQKGIRTKIHFDETTGQRDDFFHHDGKS